jgi:hypothetical protein
MLGEDSDGKTAKDQTAQLTTSHIKSLTAIVRPAHGLFLPWDVTLVGRPWPLHVGRVIVPGQLRK